MRVWNEIVKWSINIAVIVLIAVLLLICADVLSRKVFNFPIPGSFDFVCFSFAILTFFSIALVAKRGRDVRMEFISSRFHGKASLGLALFYHLLGVAVFSLFFLAAWENFLFALHTREYAPGIHVRLPTTIPWGAMTIGALLYLIEMLIQSITNVRSLFQDQREKE